MGVGPALGRRLVLTLAIEIEDFEPGDPAQPAAEGVASTVAAEAVQAGGDRAEYLLLNVVGVLAAHPSVSAPAVDHRAVQLDEPLPRLLVPVAGAFQQG